MTDINNLTTTETELEELDLIADSENYLNDLCKKEEVNVHGGGHVYTFWERSQFNKTTPIFIDY